MECEGDLSIQPQPEIKIMRGGSHLLLFVSPVSVSNNASTRQVVINLQNDVSLHNIHQAEEEGDHQGDSHHSPLLLLGVLII